MARKPDRRRGSARYLFGFSFTALVLAAMTLVLVLVVLPRRYVLNAGLKESGVSFPSEAAPFAPPEQLPNPAPPPLPRRVEVARGPAEIFWAEVQPLLRGNLHSAAIPLFTEYLEAYPEDRGVRREYAITLARAHRSSEAIQVFGQLLSQEDDPAIRLLMAREMRDLQRLEEASAEYALLVTQDPADEALALEWGRALAWGRDYGRAAEVLGSALARNPESAEVRVVLAEVYYWSGRLDDADEVLAGMDEDALERAGGNSLRADVIAALTPPELEIEEGPTSTPTALDLAIEAFVKEDYEEAATHYLEALRETPEDTSTWRAYADLLQYELQDLEGAREALRRIEASGGNDPALRFRMAQLALWTGRNSEASDRLQAMLTNLEEEAPAAVPSDSAAVGHEDIAEIRALLGDLHRWEGERTLSGEAYTLAIAADSANPRAQAGLAVLEGEIARDIEEQELPGWGGDLYSLGDSDDFARVEAGVEGVGIDGSWVWGVRGGNRWLEGFDLSGSMDRQSGLFLEMESARWWNWGTLRTGLHFGLEDVRADELDFSLGASLRFADLGGFRTDLEYDHGPAYPLTVTLQSVLAEVVQDRIQASLGRQLTDRWGISIDADATRIGTHAPGFENAEASYRFETGMNLGRSLSDALVLGTNVRALSYSAPAPTVGETRLFWDPRALVSAGIFARWDWDAEENWRIRAMANASMASIDERSSAGFETVPHISAEAGISHFGERFRTTLDAFYYQGRFDGYRAYGLRISVNAKDWFRGGKDR